MRKRKLAGGSLSWLNKMLDTSSTSEKSKGKKLQKKLSRQRAAILKGKGKMNPAHLRNLRRGALYYSCGS